MGEEDMLADDDEAQPRLPGTWQILLPHRILLDNVMHVNIEIEIEIE